MMFVFSDPLSQHAERVGSSKIYKCIISLSEFTQIENALSALATSFPAILARFIVSQHKPPVLLVKPSVWLLNHFILPFPKF